MSAAIDDFAVALAHALVTSQAELDEAGRDSIDAFSDTGVPPTVFAWTSVRLSTSATVAVSPKQHPDEVSSARLLRAGPSHLGLRICYFESPQGSDTPTPSLPSGQGST